MRQIVRTLTLSVWMSELRDRPTVPTLPGVLDGVGRRGVTVGDDHVESAVGEQHGGAKADRAGADYEGVRHPAMRVARCCG